MSARRQIIAALSEDSMGGIATLQDVEHAEQLVDALVAERDAEIMRWLGKKARECRAAGGRDNDLRASTIEVLASKISRGAVRPDNTLLPTGVAPLFFEPGRTYTRQCHGDTAEFRVQCIGADPEFGDRQAFGWYRRRPRTSWHPYSQDEAEFMANGWAEVTEGGAR